MLSFAYRGPVFRETFRYSIQGIALYPVFIVAVRYPAWGPFRLLNHPALSFLGALSYPAYLLHHVLLNALSLLSPDHAPLRALVALTLTFALAYVIHELVEKPCLRLRKRISGALLRPARDLAGRAAPSLVQARKP
jgi:peptidoglycan/LPS O-acetylase OafA/YrhL